MNEQEKKSFIEELLQSVSERTEEYTQRLQVSTLKVVQVAKCN